MIRFYIKGLNYVAEIPYIIKFKKEIKNLKNIYISYIRWRNDNKWRIKKIIFKILEWNKIGNYTNIFKYNNIVKS